MKQNKNILLAFELTVNRAANQTHMEEIFCYVLVLYQCNYVPLALFINFLYPLHHFGSLQ